MRGMEELLEKWVSILGMRDWTITLKCGVLPDEMRQGGVDGEADWTECRKSAVIRLLDERCYGERIMPYIPERVLIHELLHLKMSLLGESGNDLQDRVVHQLIDELAGALYRASHAEAKDARERPGERKRHE